MHAPRRPEPAPERARPAASTRGGDAVDVFLRDHDDSFIHRYSPNGADWTTYPASDFGGHVFTGPTAVSMSGQRIDVFTRNSDADLIRTKVNLIPETVTEIRVVDIVGLDKQADGGTHVARTDEVGRIRVLKTESKGKGNKRIRIEVVDG